MLELGPSEVDGQGFLGGASHRAAADDEDGLGDRLDERAQHAAHLEDLGLLLLVALLFPDEVLSIFTPDAAIIELSLSGYTIVLLALVLAIPGDMLYAAVVGTGDTRATLGIQLVATAAALAFTLWAALVMSLPLGMVLFVEIIVWTLYLLLSWYWLRSGRWRQLKV